MVAGTHRSSGIGFAIALLVAACSPAAAPSTAGPATGTPATPSASAAGKALLEDYVRRAKQEGELIVTVKSTWGQGAIGLAAAFNKRFGLNLKITMTSLTVNTHVAVAVSETQAGLPPTYDVLSASDTETASLIPAKAVQPIPDWQALLNEINPAVASGAVKPADISSDPYQGIGLKYLQNLKGLIYNPTKVKPEDLPKTHADVADAKYRGRFAMSSFASHWDMGPAVLQNYSEQAWLDIVRTAGKNAKATLAEGEAFPRLLLGEFDFILGQDTLVANAKTADANAPVAMVLFSDYNPVNNTWTVIRTGTKHLAAATLWSAWMTTQEAESIWQPVSHEASPYLTESADDRYQQAFLKSGSKINRYGDSKEMRDRLSYYLTNEGQAFLAALSKAVRGQ